MGSEDEETSECNVDGGKINSKHKWRSLPREHEVDKPNVSSGVGNWYGRITYFTARRFLRIV